MKEDAMGGFAWVTLATNDSYSLGALVLAHSLKKFNTAHKLAVLITPAVSQPMREQLQTVFDVVKSVDVLDSKDEAHLALLKRPELGVTFTKIHCWRLTEFEKCVFLDADTLVVRNCDELFEREEFSAAPDVSWPDCFNSGVFVYKPSVDTFNKLLQFAVEKGSFDGGDQGLLNQFFSDWATEDIKKHLPFVYNLTSVAAYSYIPAFKQYGAETRIVHFIGAGKPWLQQLDPGTRTITPTSGSEHLAPLLQQWWDLFCEKVHPNLSKNLENNNDGMSHPPVEARSNTPVALTSDEPQSPRLIEPCVQYREKDDFRQHNLPYQPFDVRGSSGELLNVEFLLASVVPQDDSSEQQRSQGGELEEKEPEPEVQEALNDTEQTKLEVVCDEPRVEEKVEEPSIPKDPFDYNTFFPDENCINNYLEQNLVTYQPFKTPHEDPQLENVPLPRFLTIPEDDQRQKGNIEVVEHEPAVELPPAPPPTPQKPAEVERRQTPPPVEKHELLKSKSMTFIPNDVIAMDIPSPPRRSIWKSQPNVNIDPNRKYSMPRLKPLLPKQNPKPVQLPRSRVTLYTEFLMSADYKDPVDLPRDEVGFVERELRRSKSEADLKGRFGPLPYAKSPEVKIPEPRKPPLRELDNDAYDLSRCKRQLGNKPRVCAKENVPSNLITPAKDKKSTIIKKRKSKELSPGDGRKEKPFKKERKEKPRYRKHENLDEILKRLWEFSKNYQHYFGVDAQNRAKERPIRPDFKQFRNFIKDKKETMQRGLLDIQDIMSEKGESAKGTNAIVQCISELEVAKIGNGMSAAVEDGERLKQSPDRCKVSIGKQSIRSIDQEQLTNNPVPGNDCLTTLENIPNGIKEVVDHSIHEPNDKTGTLKMNTNQNGYTTITQNGESLPETLSNGCAKSPVFSNKREKNRRGVTKQVEKETEPAMEPNVEIQAIVEKTIEDEYNTIKGRNNVEKDKPQDGWSLEEERTRPQSEGGMKKRTPTTNGRDSNDKLNNILEKVECDAGSGQKVSEELAEGQRDVEDTQEDATPQGMFAIGSPKKSTRPDENVASSQENKETAEVSDRSKVIKPGNKPDEILCVLDYDTPRSSRNLTLTPQPDTDANPQAPLSSSIVTSRKARIQRKPYENGTKHKSPVGKRTVKTGSGEHSAGIAGAIAQLNLESGGKGGESEAATTAAHQEYIRRQNWETGNMDYMGRDSFENIWSKICQTLEGKESDKATEGTHSPKTISTEEKTKPEGGAGAEAPVFLSMLIQKCPEFIDTLPSEPATGPAEDDEVIFTKPGTGEKHLANIKEEAENGDAGDGGSVKLSDILKPSEEPLAEVKSPEASAPQIEKDTTGDLTIKPEAPIDGVQSNQPQSEMKAPSEEAKCTTVAIRQPILIPGAPSEEPTPTKTTEAKLAEKKLQQKPETPTEPIPLPGPESLIQNECRTVAIPYPPTVATIVTETPDAAPSPSSEAPVMTSSKDEKQKKGVFSKLLEMVGVGPKVEEVSKSVFYTSDEAAPKEEVPVVDVKKDSEDVALEGERKEEALMEPETGKDGNGGEAPEPIGIVKDVGQSLGVVGRNEKEEPESKPTNGGRKKTSGKKSGQAPMPKPERKASPKPSTQGSKNKSPSPLTIPQTPPETALTAATPTPPPDAPKRRNSALLKVDDSIPMTPPVGESGEAMKSEVEKIIEKAKTEVERRSAEKEVKESGDVMNALELMSGVESAGGKAKAEGVEELKVTSEEDRERHKGEAASSKLSDQILKAIPPPRRKAISDSKSEGSESSGAIPKTSSPPGEKGKGKPSSIPVPPPRNKGKPSTTPAPPKGKTKK